METLKIRAILLAQHHKTLSRAAEAFSYTPSALSHMTDSLEEELGVPLLVRTRSGVHFTEEGELLREKLQAVLDAEQALRDAAAAIGEEKRDQLRIGAYSSIANYILPSIVKRFKKENPDVRVSITVADSMRDRLETDLSDVIFGDEVALGEHSHEIIMKDPFVAVIPEGMFLGRRSVSREELYPYAYISTNESILRRYFDESRFAEILRFDSVDDHSVLSMVKEGIGVAVLPSLATRKPERGVRILRLTPSISRSIGFAYQRKTPAIERFAAFMKTVKV